MIHVFIGTKAQLIKMAPIMRELDERGIDFNYISSGQHNDTVDDLIECFDIKSPDVVLYSGRDITGIVQMLSWAARIVFGAVTRRREIFRQDTNAVVLNHGDTFSTLLGSVLGRLAGAKVAHIESGLRSFNLLHPFPEEVTRLMVFRLSHLFFAPGAWAVANLRKYRGTVYDTKANTLVDSLRVAARNFSRCDVDVPNSQYAVASIHRFENVFRRSRLEWIVDELIAVSQTVPLLFILHLPTKKKLEKFGLMEKLRASERIELRPRYDYLNFIKLVSTSEFVISDGGSNQEECSYLGKPCLLFRDKTERQEGIGKNVVLSHYEHSRVEDFLARYRDLALAADPVDGSPAADIVDQLAPYYPHR